MLRVYCWETTAYKYIRDRRNNLGTLHANPFGDPIGAINRLMKATCESMIVESNLDSALAQSRDESINRSPEPTVNLIGQCFSSAFADELQLRGLVAGRTVMRTLGTTEILQDNRYRTRVEFDIVTAIPGTTHNDLIDILVSAKRKCSAKIGSRVKIFLKAELRSAGFEFGLVPQSRLSY